MTGDVTSAPLPGVVLAGTESGCGKTVATMAVLRALQAAGGDPQPAKAGPDFIDPSHHAVVADRPSRTLDTWLQGAEGARRNYARGSGDCCVVEGMMGLYDGGAQSTAGLAAALDLPVVLVVDASAGMESVGATALGFREYAATAGVDVEVAGVLAQRCHGGRHEAGVREALPDGLRYVGRVPPVEDLAIPDRHLGLHTGTESPVPDDALDRAAETVDAGALLDLARPAEPPATPPSTLSSGGAEGPTVAVARDRAFAFCYPATTERLRDGGTVEPFSPLAGDPLPDCDAVYLPGGYPERFAADLADSRTLDDLAAAAADGLPVLGECGGLMVLAETLTTVESNEFGDRNATEPGTTYEMAGVLPADVRMHDRYQALDHVELRAERDTLTAATGSAVRGHEFHYSSIGAHGDAVFAFSVERGTGIDGERDGLVEYRTLGTYAHVHPESGAFDRVLATVGGSES